MLRELETELGRLDEHHETDPRRILELFDAALGLAPVLLVIDEFGKCLEFAAQDSRTGDLYLLQQLAERVSGGPDVEGLVLTLQHLAFEDYVGLVSSAQRREWRKVQGRFEELPFVNDEELGWRVAAEAISPPSDPQCRRRSLEAVEDALGDCSSAGLELPDRLCDFARRCYPIHPIALWILPELASRFGQGERTLAQFLTSESPGSVRHFLARTEVEQGTSALASRRAL